MASLINKIYDRECEPKAYLIYRLVALTLGCANVGLLLFLIFRDVNVILAFVMFTILMALIIFSWAAAENHYDDTHGRSPARWVFPDDEG